MIFPANGKISVWPDYSLLVLFILTTLTSPKAPLPMTRMTSKSDRRILNSDARRTKGPVHSRNSVTCFSRFRFEFSSSLWSNSSASNKVSYENPWTLWSFRVRINCSNSLYQMVFSFSVVRVKNFKTLTFNIYKTQENSWTKKNWKVHQ